MINIEPRIYRVILHFNDSKPWNMQQLCNDLGIIAEQQEPIKKDEWGIRGVLELWFQKIEDNSTTLHIQKKHSYHNKTYLKDLEAFFCDCDNLDYLQKYEEVIFNK